MNIQDSIGELLYIGIVAEKGRCYGMRWKKNYKKNLKTHIRALNKLQIVLKSNDINEIKNCVNDFINMCKKNSNFGKFYNFKVDYVDSFFVGEHYIEVEKLLDDLFDDLLFELNKFFVSKEKVYYLLATMHNLPRVYLGEDKETLCELKQISISESEAIDYAYRNMDKHLKEKYCNILKK